ncbi:hypothetical protein B484DRAFT_391644 [Ochromonadaceae sp. CCMP2298]|nr:hypothetical protein B484DRAFT_391644 [Ochromonadaceae sp. CCMP2298]
MSCRLLVLGLLWEAQARYDHPYAEPWLYKLDRSHYGALQHIAYITCVVVDADAVSSTWSFLPSHHSLFISQHYRDSWRAVEDLDTGAMGFNASAFNFYVHAPSRTDRSACPAGYDALIVLVPVPPLPSADESSGPLYDHVRDPVAWASEFNLHRGAAFGLSRPLTQLAFFRPPIRDPRTARAYRVGSSTRPGNGVPLVMVSAALATKRILADVVRELAYTPLHGGQSEQSMRRRAR